MKTIPGFSDYQITKDGWVWSKSRISPQGHRIGNRWLSPQKKKRGQFNVTLCILGKNFTRLVHRLILKTFVGPCPDGMECRHLNGNPADNRLRNLCWGTHLENMQDRDLHGRTSHPQGEKHPLVKLKIRDVRMIIYTHRTGLFTMQEIATQFRISIASISLIVNRKRWKHLWAV